MSCATKARLCLQKQGELGCLACARCFTAQTDAVALEDYARSGDTAAGATAATTAVLQARACSGRHLRAPNRKVGSLAFTLRCCLVQLLLAICQLVHAWVSGDKE